MYLFKLVFSFGGDIYPAVELLDLMGSLLNGRKLFANDMSDKGLISKI